MKLTDAHCRSAKGANKPIKLTDGAGLYLYITPANRKIWRQRYYYDGREQTLVLGRYPEMSLSQARRASDETKQVLASGNNPAHQKKLKRKQSVAESRNGFSMIAEEWMDTHQSVWTLGYAKVVRGRVSNAKQFFADIPINQITPVMVVNCARTIEARGAPNMAIRVRRHLSAIFAYAIATGRCESNPALSIGAALVKPLRTRRPAALTLPTARETLRTIEAHDQTWWATIFASRLTALTAQRPGTVRLAEKSEFKDLGSAAPIWQIPAAKLKLRKEQKQDRLYDFMVPLSDQAAQLVLLAMEKSPSATLIFPGQQGWRRPISDSTLSKLYREAGLTGKHVPHGWRASFSTIMNEWSSSNGVPGDRAIIDLMLAHFPDDVESAYNRASYMPRRRELAQIWADLLLADFPVIPAPY